MQKRIWISWEKQRRSIELSKKFDCELFIFDYEGFTRYPKSIIKTLYLLNKYKPDILFVQNPSMFLAVTACIYRIFSKTFLIVDRHTNFRLTRQHEQTLNNIIFKIFHKFTIRTADITIVTNHFLADLVTQLGGKSFVLPDSLPEISKTKSIKLKGAFNILLISSFGNDEPIEEAIEAVKTFADKKIYLYITGRYNKKYGESIIHYLPSNIIFTGYMKDDEFINMLFSADVIMALTTADYTMLCGCYEAVAACKPLITSNKKVLMNYFTKAIFVDNSIDGISIGIKDVMLQMDICRKGIKELKQMLCNDWGQLHNNFEQLLTSINI